jgi:sugar phosphate isomerase/epimerase
MLKLGTCLYNFIWQNDLVGAMTRAASLGFGAVEIMATPPQLDARSFSDRQCEELLRLVGETGMEIVSLNPTFIDINLGSRNDAFRRESVREVKACIDVAVRLNAKLVVIGPGRRHPLVLEPADMVNRLAHPAMRECIEYAENKGIIYGFENITSLYMVHCEEVADFIDRVDSPYCKAVYDVANASYYENPADGIRLLGERICHVHLSDTDGSVRAHWPIGKGTIDFAEVAESLREVGYGGWSFLETTWMEDPEWAILSSAEALKEHGWLPVPPVTSR